MGKSQIELILQVYDGAIAAYKAASECYQNSDFEGGFTQLEKAKRFLTHLYTTLDEESGGEISENLAKLYAFMISQTDLTIATKDLTVIRGNLKILNNLRAGWAGIKVKTEGPAGKTAAEAKAAASAGTFTTSG